MPTILSSNIMHIYASLLRSQLLDMVPQSININSIAFQPSPIGGIEECSIEVLPNYPIILLFSVLRW